MSRGRAAGSRRAVLAFLLASLAAVPASAGSHAGETKPIHNDHPHRHDRTPSEEVGIESQAGSPEFSSRVPAVSTRATDHDVVVRPEVPEEAPASPSASPKEDGDDDGTLNAHTAKDASRETHDASLSEDADADADATNESTRDDEASTNETSTNEASTNEASTHEPHVPPIQGSNLEKKKRTVLLTWGIGGDRVGRPSDASATPPGLAEGVPPGDSVVWAAAAGHTALVTDAGAVYTAGRNDSAGGGGHGSPPVSDAGQLGRGGSTNVFELVPTPADVFATQVACGRYHTAAVTANGGVLTFGLNDRGQLGRAGVFGDPDLKKACGCDSAGNCACAGEGEEDVTKKSYEKNEPCRGGWACRDGVARFADLGLDPVSREPRAASFVAAGRYSTVVVTKSGDVLIWGLNACGGAFDDAIEKTDDAPGPSVASFLDRLVNDAAFASTPRFLSRDVFFDGSAVEIAAVGYVHVAFLTSDGRVFTCDTGFDGYAGGLGNPYTPNEDGRLGRALFLSVAANSTDEASSRNAGAALDVAEATERAALTPGEVTVRDDANDASKDASKRTPVVAVDAGRCHTVVADANGGAFAFGCGALGGAGPDGRPRALDLSRDVVVLPASTDEGTDRIENENENENENETPATNQNRSASSPFAVDVAAGEYFTLVATRDGSVFAFGDGNSGQFGVDKEALRAAREKQSHNNENAAADVAWFRSRGSGNDAGRVLVPVAGYQHAAAIVEAYGE